MYSTFARRKRPYASGEFVCFVEIGEPIRSRIVGRVCSAVRWAEPYATMDVFAGEMEKPAVAGMDVERDDRHGRFADKPGIEGGHGLSLHPCNPCCHVETSPAGKMTIILRFAGGPAPAAFAGIVPLFAVERVDIMK